MNRLSSFRVDHFIEKKEGRMRDESDVERVVNTHASCFLLKAFDAASSADRCPSQFLSATTLCSNTLA